MGGRGPDDAACEICEQPSSADRLNRNYGLSFCDGCRVRPGHAIAGWGAQVHGREWTTEYVDSEGHRQITWHAQVDANGPATLPAGVFGGEHLGHKLVKLFVREVQVGDPLFDDNIYVKTADRSGMARLLSREGIQSAVLELVVGQDCEVTLNARGLSAVRAGEHVNLESLMLPAVALLRNALLAERAP